MSVYNESLIHLGYISKSVEPMNGRQLNEILRKSRQRNEKNSITGMLLYSQGSFLQILEGSPLSIHEIFSSIKSDLRHHSINVLFEENLSHRHFCNWAMGFCHLQSSEIARAPGMEHLLQRERLLSDFFIAQADPATLLQNTLMHFRQASF